MYWCRKYSCVSENRLIGESRAARRGISARRQALWQFWLPDTPRAWNITALLHDEDSNALRKKQKTAEVYNASDGPQEDNIRFANTLKEALAAPNLLHAFRPLVVWWRVGTSSASIIRTRSRCSRRGGDRGSGAAAPTCGGGTDEPLMSGPSCRTRQTGRGRGDDFHDGHLRNGEACRKDGWALAAGLPQALYQRQLKQPWQPKCCFCLSMLSYIAERSRPAAVPATAGPCGWLTATAFS